MYRHEIMMDEGGSNQQQDEIDFDDAPMRSDHNEEGGQVANDEILLAG